MQSKSVMVILHIHTTGRRLIHFLSGPNRTFFNGNYHGAV